MKALLSFALFLTAAAVVSPVRADEEGDDEAVAIAHHYGMDDFDRVEALKFTCNVRQGTTTVARTWNWDLTGHRVSLDTRQAGRPFHHVYDPRSVGSGNGRRDAEVDRWFTADREWLLFPLRFTEDRNMEISLDEDQPLPIPPGRADLLTIDYAGDDSGAGDTDEVYFDDENRLIRQRVFRKGGAADPTLVATWDDHERLGPILVSLRHRSGDGRTEIWFTNVEARVRGSDTWIRPHPGT